MPEGWVLTDIGELLTNRDSERVPLSLGVRSKQENKIYDYYGATGVVDKVDGYLFDERLLLIGEDGANLLSRSKDNAFFAEGKYWVNNHAHILDCPEKEVLDYVAFLINSMSLEDYITGSAQPKLNQDNLNKIEIPLPPLEEQRRIIAQVNLWQSFIQHLEAHETELKDSVESAKSKILDLAIHGKLVPQDPSDEPASELLKRINPNAVVSCDNPHYLDLPNGWILCNLENVIELYDNYRKPINGSERQKRKSGKTTASLYPYYGATGLVDYIDSYLLDGQYILLGEDGAPFLDASAKKAFIVQGKFWVNNHAHVLKSLISTEYLVHVLNCFDYGDYVKGSTRLKLTQKDMLGIPVYLPPYNEQLRIVSMVNDLFSQLDMIETSLQA